MIYKGVLFLILIIFVIESKTNDKSAGVDPNTTTTRSSLIEKNGKTSSGVAPKYHSNNSLLKTTKTKEKKEEPPAEPEYSFPPFNFDGS